jgi:hypothetical protein
MGAKGQSVASRKAIGLLVREPRSTCRSGTIRRWGSKSKNCCQSTGAIEVGGGVPVGRFVQPLRLPVALAYQTRFPATKPPLSHQQVRQIAAFFHACFREGRRPPRRRSAFTCFAARPICGTAWTRRPRGDTLSRALTGDELFADIAWLRGEPFCCGFTPSSGS